MARIDSVIKINFKSNKFSKNDWIIIVQGVEFSVYLLNFF